MELSLDVLKPASFFCTDVSPIWSDSDTSFLSILGSPGKPVPDPEVGILSNTPALRPPDSSPFRPTSSARVQSPSLSIKSSRDSSIISSIPSSIPSSTAPSPSLSIPSLYGLPKSSVPTSYKTMSVLGTR